MHSVTVFFLVLMCLVCPVFAADIHLELVMPGSMFGPGSSFSLDLAIENAGGTYSNARLFVALTVGTGDFWFYPAWAQFPPQIDWQEVSVSAGVSDQWAIIPEFSWPYGAGSFDGAQFIAAVMDGGLLISNLAQTHFGWSEDVQPSPTPTGIPTPTPSATPTGPAGLVLIPPGVYWRGSPDYEPCRQPFDTDETQHLVTLTRSIYMMKTEVTRQMWADLKAVQTTLPNDPSDTSISPWMQNPVQYVLWYEAVLFANLKSLQNGFVRCYYKDAALSVPVDATNYTYGTFYCRADADGYRLPTEAEWEYAVRAGTEDGPFYAYEPDYSSVNCTTCSPSPPLTVLNTIAWWCGNSSTTFGQMTHAVGTRLPNPWGLHDMHGNVKEWCWDWIGPYPSAPVTDPVGPATGSGRVFRGGAWASNADYCRSAVRGYYSPNTRSHTIGFRLVRSAD